MAEKATEATEEVVEQTVVTPEAGGKAEVVAPEEDASKGAEAMSTILNAVKENPALGDDPEIAKVLEMAGQKSPEKPKAETKEEAKGEPKAEKKEEVKAEKKEEVKAETKEEADSKFFGKKEEVKKEVVEINSLDEFTAHLEDKYAIKDVDTFLKSADKWRKGSQENGDTEDKLEDLQNAFKEMPKPLFDAFSAWADGNEWQGHVQGTNAGVDYNAQFDEYELYDIVNHYFPEEFEEDDFTEDSDDATVIRAVKLSKKQFESEKSAFEEQRADLLDDGKKNELLLKSSTSSSVEKLKEAFPNLDKKAFTEVKNIMASGDLSTLFFNKDGSYTDDAAEKLALMLYGKEEIIRANGRAKKSQEVLKDSVSNGAEKPSVKNTQSQQTAVPEEVTGVFKDMFVKTHY